MLVLPCAVLRDTDVERRMSAIRLLVGQLAQHWRISHRMQAWLRSSCSADIFAELACMGGAGESREHRLGQ